MSKKYTPYADIVHSTLVIAIAAAVGLCTLTVGAGLSAMSSGPKAASYNPKSLNYSLFDLQSFVLDRRARRAAALAPAAASQDASLSDTPVTDQAESPVPAADLIHPAAPEKPLTLDQLSAADRATLSQQLRMHVCPQNLESAYRTLCELLLKAQPARPSLKGLASPGH